MEDVFCLGLAAGLFALTAGLVWLTERLRGS